MASAETLDKFIVEIFEIIDRQKQSERSLGYIGSDRRQWDRLFGGTYLKTCNSPKGNKSIFNIYLMRSHNK